MHPVNNVEKQKDFFPLFCRETKLSTLEDGVQHKINHSFLKANLCKVCWTSVAMDTLPMLESAKPEGFPMAVMEIFTYVPNCCHLSQRLTHPSDSFFCCPVF